MFRDTMINSTDIYFANNQAYMSTYLHDYMLNNFFVAFAMGILLGVIIGLNSYLLTDHFKRLLNK